MPLAITAKSRPSRRRWNDDPIRCRAAEDAECPYSRRELPAQVQCCSTGCPALQAQRQAQRPGTATGTATRPPAGLPLRVHVQPMSGPLDAASVRFFKHHGYLVVHRLVPEPQLASYRKQFWDHVGAESSDPGTWPAPPPGGGQLPNIMELRPNLGDLPEIAAVIEQTEGSLEGDQGRAVADGRRAARHDPSLLSPVATSGWPLGPISGLVAYAYICNFTVCSIRGVSMLP
jgi:hypothetical protein